MQRILISLLSLFIFVSCTNDGCDFFGPVISQTSIFVLNGYYSRSCVRAHRIAAGLDVNTLNMNVGCTIFQRKLLRSLVKKKKLHLFPFRNDFKKKK